MNPFWIIFKTRLLLDKNLSGPLSPELSRLSNMKILWVPYGICKRLWPISSSTYDLFLFIDLFRDFMWNNISGTIPKEIGNITSLELLWVEAHLLECSYLVSLFLFINMQYVYSLVINLEPWSISYISLTETCYTDS